MRYWRDVEGRPVLQGQTKVLAYRGLNSLLTTDKLVAALD